MSKNLAKKLIIYLFAFVIIFSILTLFVWIFTERYVWPDIFPKHLSLRAFNSIVIKSDDLSKTFAVSILISTVVSLISVTIAVLSARAMCFFEFKGKAFMSFVMLAPFLVPTTVFGMGVQILLLRMGLGGTLSGVILCHIIYSLPYANKLLEEGTKALGKGLEEQARVLGARPVFAFFCITLPNLLPTVLSAFTMSYIISISQYFLTLIIGGGNIKTFSVVMVPYMQSGERNFASIYAVIFLGITVIVFFIFEALAKAVSKGNKVEYFN